MSANKEVKRLALTLVCFRLFLLALVPAAAQSLTASDPSFDLEIISDVFIGKNTRGPYVLSWKNIEAQSEVIILSGRRLAREQDYTIDYTSGILAFNELVTPNTIARVTYRRVPGKSVQNSGGLSLPLDMNLFSSDRMNLNATGILNSGSGQGNSPGLAVIGLSSEMKLTESSNISTMFAVGENNSQSGGDNVGLADRSAMKVSASASTGVFGFSGSFARAGERFGSAKEYGLQEAQENTDLYTTLGNASGPVSASFSYKNQSDLRDSQNGANQTASEQKLVLNLENAPKLTLSHATTGNKDPNGAKNSASLDTLQIENSFGAKTTATAMLRKSSTTGGAGDEVDTMRLAVDSSAFDRVRLQGSFTKNDSEKKGNETGIDFKINAAPNDRISMGAALSSVDSSLNGQKTAAAVQIGAKPVDRVDLNANVSWLDSEKGGHTAADFRIMASPIDQLRVEGSYSGKQVDRGDDEVQRGVRLEVQPAGFLKLFAGIQDKSIGRGLQSTKEAGVEFTPGDFLRLSSNIREFGDGALRSCVRDYSGAIKPINYVELSGAYRSREDTTTEDLESKLMQLAIGPPQLFRITGQYSYNPENKEGIVQRLSSAALGLELKLGVLGITGGYAEKDEYMANTASLEREVGLNLRLFRNGKLSTGFKIAQDVANMAQATCTYSIGYTHDLRSTFNLSLTGELTRFEQEQLFPNDEYKVTVKLGIKF